MEKIETVDFDVEVLNIERHSVLDDFVLKVRGRVAIADKPTLKDTIFPEDELKVKYKTLENMPLNLNHQQDEIIGCITKADMVYPEKSNPEVWIYAIIWEFLKPDVGSAVRREGKDGKLTFSAEVYSDYAVCPVCGKQIDYVAWKAGIDLCEHWKTSDLRKFKDFLFLGCALLLPPARPAVKEAKAELYKFDFSKITIDYLKKLSNDELIKLHNDLHKEYQDRVWKKSTSKT